MDARILLVRPSIDRAHEKEFIFLQSSNINVDC